MVRVWREYTAPDGRNYYYNVNTKQSTWHRPVSYDDEIDDNQNTKRLKKVEPKAHVALELLHGWHLIICDTGKRFYHNLDSEESTWDLPDEESRGILGALDKDKLVALIGLARGYSLGGLHIYDELVADISKLKQDRITEKSNEVTQELEVEKDGDGSYNEDSNSDDERDRSIGEEAHGRGLVAGYSSSSSEDEQEGEEEEDLPSISMIKTAGESFDTSEDKKVLWELFNKYDLDPYSAWPFEMKKVRDDPDFNKVMDDFVREDAFEEWCAHLLSENYDSPATEGLPKEQLEDEDFDGEDDLEPTRYHYLSHIVSKSTINSTTIFMDIKNENKSLFKKYHVKDFIPAKKDQETFVSKLLFYYKRMDLKERKRVFIQFLQQHSKTISGAISKDFYSLRNTLDSEIDTNDPYAVETKLFKMEKAMGLQSILLNLAEEPRYHVLGIRDKMLELNNYLNTFL